MKSRIKFILIDGKTKNDYYDKLAHHMWQYFRMKEADGKIGLDNIISHDEIRREVGSFINEHKWIKQEDRLNIDRYVLFIENTTRYIMNGYLMNIKLMDKNFKSGRKWAFYPGLLNKPWQGYFIAKTHEEVYDAKNDRSKILGAMEYALDVRTTKADTHIEQLESGKKKHGELPRGVV